MITPALKRHAADVVMAHMAADVSADGMREEIAALRKQHGALRLARKIGVTDQYIRDLCAGRRRPGIALARKIWRME